LTTISRSERALATPSSAVLAACDDLRFAEIIGLAERAASYWHSIALAAERGERLTIEVHCRQAAAVTREAFTIVKTLGAEPDEAQAAA
jgi:hypothetical protein